MSPLLCETSSLLLSWLLGLPAEVHDPTNLHVLQHDFVCQSMPEGLGAIAWRGP